MSNISTAYDACPNDPSSIYSFMKFFDIHPMNYGWGEANHYDLISGDYYAIPAAKRIVEAFDNKAKVRFLVYADILRWKEVVSPKVYGIVLEQVWTSLGLSIWRPKTNYLQAEGFFEAIAFDDILHSEENKAFFNSLPKEITVYRGTTVISQTKAQNGMSWTTDYDKAASFALKDGLKAPNRICLKGTIQKTKILAAYNKGQEIVVPSGEVSRITKEPVILTERTAALLDQQTSIAA